MDSQSSGSAERVHSVRDAKRSSCDAERSKYAATLNLRHGDYFCGPRSTEDALLSIQMGNNWSDVGPYWTDPR